MMIVWKDFRWILDITLVILCWRGFDWARLSIKIYSEIKLRILPYIGILKIMKDIEIITLFRSALGYTLLLIWINFWLMKLDMDNCIDIHGFYQSGWRYFSNGLLVNKQYRDFKGIHVCGIVYHICGIVFHVCGNFDPQMWYSIPHMWYTQIFFFGILTIFKKFSNRNLKKILLDSYC